MKKEKKVRQYTRKTKSGKTVIVKAHTAKYDAADKAKEIAKKKGAGEELEERKKKKPTQLEISFDFDKEGEKKVLDEIKDTEKKSSKKVRPVGSGTNGPTPKKKSEEKSTKKIKAETSEPAFTAAEFKEWYRGTGSAADKKVAKALRAQLGRAGYRKLEDEAIDNYSSRGHLSMFKRVSGGSEVSAKTKVATKDSSRKVTIKDIEDALGWSTKRSKAFNSALKKITDSGIRTTGRIKEELAKAGFDYDTGKRIPSAKKPTSTKDSPTPTKPSDPMAEKRAKWKKAETEAGKMFDKYVAKNGYPGDGKPAMTVLGKFLRQTLKKHGWDTDDNIEKKVRSYLY